MDWSPSTVVPTLASLLATPWIWNYLKTRRYLAHAKWLRQNGVEDAEYQTARMMSASSFFSGDRLANVSRERAKDAHRQQLPPAA